MCQLSHLSSLAVMVTTSPVCHLLFCIKSHLPSLLRPKCHPFSLSDTCHDKSHQLVKKPVSWQVPLTEGLSHVLGVWLTLQSWLMPSEYTETAWWGHAIPSWLSQGRCATITCYVAQSGFDTQTRCYQGCWRPTCFLTPFGCSVDWTLAPSVIYYSCLTQV